jgi:hypothetical protein
MINAKGHEYIVGRMLAEDPERHSVLYLRLNTTKNKVALNVSERKA